MKKTFMAAIAAVLVCLFSSAQASTYSAAVERLKQFDKRIKPQLQQQEKQPVQLLKLSNGQLVNPESWTIVLFMASDCGYCKKFDPKLKAYSQQTGISVFPYSINGEGDPTFPKAIPAPPMVIGQFFARGIPIATPTTFLVNIHTMRTYPMLQGDATPEQVANRVDALLKIALQEKQK